MSRQSTTIAAGVVYFVHAPAANLLKIGFTARPFALRLMQLRSNSPVSLDVLAVIRGTRDSERKLHARFLKLWSHGEWFRDDAGLLSYVSGLDGLPFPESPKPKPPRAVIGRDYGKPIRVVQPLDEWARATTITSRGKTMTAAEWSEIKKIDARRIRRWLELGCHPDNLFMIDMPIPHDVSYSVPRGLEGMIDT